MSIFLVLVSVAYASAFIYWGICMCRFYQMYRGADILKMMWYGVEFLFLTIILFK